MYCETSISFSFYVGMPWLARLDPFHTFLVLTRKVRKPDSSLLRIPQWSLLYTKKKKKKKKKKERKKEKGTIPTPLHKGWNCPPNPLYFHNIMVGPTFSFIVLTVFLSGSLFHCALYSCFFSMFLLNGFHILLSFLGPFKTYLVI